MLGVARELTVVLHAMWQKALGPRLSASYTCTVPFFVTSMSKIARGVEVLRAPQTATGTLHLHAAARALLRRRSRHDQHRGPCVLHRYT